MARPKVRFDPTPNPEAGKLTVDRVLVPGRSGHTFTSAEEARGNTLAERVLAVEGVAEVFVVADFVTVTKESDAAWPALEGPIRAAIQAAL